MNDLISVIIPVYNSENTLEKCVNSVRNQTFTNLEIILIDDGSIDKSAEICDRLADEDCRVKVFHYENGGAGKARNIGIKKSTGQYIAFVDSDDYIDEAFLSILYKTITEKNCDLVVSSINNVTYNRDFITTFNKSEEFYFLCKNNILYAPWAKLYKSRIIKSNKVVFPVNLNFGEDMVFNIRHMYCINSISYVNKCFYHYIRDNHNSLSQKIRWNMFENDMIFERQLMKLFEEKKLFEGKIKKYDAYRILGVAYDSIFLLTRKDCPFKNTEIKEYIKRIVNDDLVQWSLSEVDTSMYAQWVIKPMKRKAVNYIKLLTSLKRIMQ